ncbi:sensor histidine kinase [Terracidiphilus gabretensis]|uniref:sensor histidine kinase n=1 Tax=Terracidiphilus gabretensis TaxID=1577687 RepID=UPI00071BD8A1|nr:sensor histidine kinase [Terracidiphilus gabretensis]
MFLLAAAACALVPATPLSSMNRQSWAMENGLPQNTVHAIAQTSDGYLWLGTEAGLVRFDGVQFAVFDRASKPALPDNDVRCLLAASDGALWIGTADGLARLDHGTVTVYTTANGLPANAIHGLVMSGNDMAIIETVAGTVGIRGGKILPPMEDMPVVEDAANLTVLLSNGEFASASLGRLELLRNGHKVAQFSTDIELPGSRIQTLLADREGALWIGTNRGLARIVDGKPEFKVDKLPVTDPLASASIVSLFEDREGNIWIGTETSGLHVLRDQRFLSIGAPEGLSSDETTALVEDGAGKLWIGTNGGGLNALRITKEDWGNSAGLATSYVVPDVLLSKVILSLAPARGPDDIPALWVGTPDGLNRVRGSAVDSFTSADGLPDDFIRSLLVDRDGSLWVGTRHGLAHWNFSPDGRTVVRRKTFTHADGLGNDLVGALARDTHGDLWIATLAGLSRLSGGKITNYTTADGLSSNVITALHPRGDGTLLIGTEDRGWNLWDKRGFHPVQGGSDHAAIHAILDDGVGHLWFATGNGIARCDAAGLSTNACPNWIEFGIADGLRSRGMSTNGHPAAWRSADGRLWFATPKGLIAVDPAHFPVNTVPPPVSIERFTIDDADQALHAADSLLSVESGRVHFEFDYAAMSFTAPQKVRYRYMLEGFDKAWTDAGSRRTAYYTNIPPGTYTFRVQAANNDGVWNTTGAALRFELRPRFYQTIWFYVLLGLALILLIILALRYRLRRAEREFGAVLAERSRIAREIHDTLAQGYVGVSVQLEVLSELLRRNRLDAAQTQLDSTRETVREGLADARQSIWALRSQDAGETTLPVRLRRIVEQASGNGLDARFNIHGAYRAFDTATEQEILRIAQEAIHNGKSHARAPHLWVRLDYIPGEAALEVRDDGQGFVPPVADGRVESPPGHYGLTGMRERAEGIGGVLEVESSPGEGTAVRLRIPVRKDALMDVPRDAKEKS